MIDSLNSRRNCNLRCVYWKAMRSTKAANSVLRDKASQELLYGTRPDGVFYARYASGSYSSNSQSMNVFQSEVNTIGIKTPDDVDLSPNDVVELKGERWIVQNCQTIREGRSQYSDRVKERIIYLRRGA